MTVILSSLTEGQAVTVINIFIATVQYTLPLLLVILLIHFMPNINTALAWNSISQTLHSSLWPTLLRTDSSRLTGSGVVVRTIALLFKFSMILLPVSRVLLPLGLSDGPFRLSPDVQLDSKYVPDTSALKLATSPDRDLFVHGYKCAPRDVGCDANNITANIPPSLYDMFNSTPHGPFSIQYRRFLNVEGQAATMGYPGSAETFLMRNDSFVAEGLVIDMSSAHPGLGFINHTIPTVATNDGHGGDGMTNGGIWSQDILFLEPITSCVDTNLTLEYTFNSGLNRNGANLRVQNYSITDRGGFVNLPDAPANTFAVYDGDFDLRKHAYNGAVLATTVIMQFLNTSKSSSFVNKTYPVIYSSNSNKSITDPFPIFLGRVTPFPLEILPLDPSVQDVWGLFLRTACDGFRGQDPMDISKVHVTCGMFLGPPLRTDGGENNVYEPGSKWFQSLHTCASSTRASVQTFTFSVGSFNDSNTANLTASRGLNRPTVLWALEKRNETISESFPLWGRIDERYLDEDPSSYWTMRSDQFLLPATSGSTESEQLPEGSPHNAHATIWLWVNAPLIIEDVAPSLTDYSGATNYAMKSKFQEIVVDNGPVDGAEIVLKLIWTDMLANQLVGTTKNDTLSVSVNLHTLDYDFRFATPGGVLALIWLPVFLSATSLLALGKLRTTYLKDVYNHLSIGRVVTNTSALRMASDPSPSDKQPEGQTDKSDKDWAKNVGGTQVKMALDHKEPQSETMRLMPTRSFLDGR